MVIDMVIKTFNVEEGIYNKFLQFCRDNGMSMSRQIEFFMRSIVEEEPKARKEYLQKLDSIRKQKTIDVGSVKDLRKRFGMK